MNEWIIHQGFLPEFKKSFIPEKPFAEHICLQNIFRYFSIAANWKFENHVSLFNRKKASAISANTFSHWEVLKHETEAMLTWVRNKLTVYLLI